VGYEVVANSTPASIQAFRLEAGQFTDENVNLDKSVSGPQKIKVTTRSNGIISFNITVISDAGVVMDIDTLSAREIAQVGNPIDAGTHSYKVTFVNAHGETSGGVESNTITADALNGEVNLTNIPIGPTGVVARKIYRTFAGFEEPTTGATAALAGAGAGNLDNDKYTYRVTFVNANGETLGSPVSNEITVVDNSVDGQISLTAIPIGPTGTTSRKIYRTEGGGSVYKLQSTIGDNTTTTATDNIADGSLGAEIPSTVHQLLTTIGDNTTTTYIDKIADTDLDNAVPTSNTAAARPTDWAGLNNPAWALEHSSGNTEGIIFGGAENNKNDIYVVHDGSEDVSDENILFFRLNTGDNNGLVGGIEYGGRPIVFTKNNGFIIDKTDSNVNNWTYFKAPWTGGTINNRTLVKVFDDVYSMAPDGNVYRISTVQDFGDYKTQSLTRATGNKLFDFNRWIKENVDFSFSEDFHGEYVPDLNAVRFWVVRQSKTTVDTAMTYFIDFDRWLVHDNRDSNSGFSASISTIVEETDGSQVVYTGDYSGNVWKLDQTARNDNSNGYKAVIKTNNMLLPQGNTIDERQFYKVHGIYEEVASQDFEVNAWVDGNTTGAGQIDMTNNYGDFKIEQVGRNLQLELYNDTADEDFFLMGLVIFFNLLDQRERRSTDQR
jgi:hypothetical protein